MPVEKPAEWIGEATAGSSEETKTLFPEVCRKLRTKQSFLPMFDAENQAQDWRRGDSSTAVYWCTQTMECAGPDGGLVHATLCGEDRACHLRRAG